MKHCKNFQHTKKAIYFATNGLVDEWIRKICNASCKGRISTSPLCAEVLKFVNFIIFGYIFWNLENSDLPCKVYIDGLLNKRRPNCKKLFLFSSILFNLQASNVQLVHWAPCLRIVGLRQMRAQSSESADSSMKSKSHTIRTSFMTMRSSACVLSTGILVLIQHTKAETFFWKSKEHTVHTANL